MRSFDTPRIRALRQILDEQGRSISWLAKRIGYSYSYTHAVLHGKREASPAIVEAIYDAIGKQAYTVDTHRGRSVMVPSSVYRRQVPDEVVADEYASAWMKDWVHEHGPTVLAQAAQRAYQRATEYGIADTGAVAS